MNIAKSNRWQYWTTAILLLICSAWVVRDFRLEPDRFPFEPVLGFISYLFLLAGYYIFRNDSAEVKTRNESAHQSAEKIYNIRKIKTANFHLALKGGYLLSLVVLLAICIWQKDALKSWLGYDRFFSKQDENFRILILPFKRECAEGGYDAGFVLKKRLDDISDRENLKISVRYWNEYNFKDWVGKQTARELQRYHQADMLLYGSYQTGDCSAEGEQFCLNYVTDEKWNLGTAGTNFSAEYQEGGFDDLKKGKFQEKIENIAVFVSLLAQIKSLDHEKYLQKLQPLLNDPDFSTNSKLGIYLELCDKLIEEGKLKEPLQQFEKVLQFTIQMGNKEYQGIFLSRIGIIHTSLGNLDKALTFFERYNQLEKELYEAYPQNVEFKNHLAISYQFLGITHTSLGNLDKALTFFEDQTLLVKELYEAYPQNVEFKNHLAISYSKLGDTHYELGNLDMALTFFEDQTLLFEELYNSYPQSVYFKNGLASSYSNLGDTHTALGNLDMALTFFEEGSKFMKEVNEDYPQNVSFKNGLAISYSNLGTVHTALGNLDMALTFSEQANATIKALYEAYPQNVSFKNGLAISYERLGTAYTALENLDMALTFFEYQSQLYEELHQAHPQNMSFKNYLVMSYHNLGNTHTMLGNLDKALTFFEERSRLGKELYENHPQNMSFKNDLAISYVMLAEFNRLYLEDTGKAKVYFQKAEKLWVELVRDAPQAEKFQSFLGKVRKELGDLDK